VWFCFAVLLSRQKFFDLIPGSAHLFPVWPAPGIDQQGSDLPRLFQSRNSTFWEQSKEFPLARE
jgi:hypothetical protein